MSPHSSSSLTGSVSLTHDWPMLVGCGSPSCLLHYQLVCQVKYNGSMLCHTEAESFSYSKCPLQGNPTHSSLYNMFLTCVWCVRACHNTDRKIYFSCANISLHNTVCNNICCMPKLVWEHQQMISCSSVVYYVLHHWVKGIKCHNIFPC